MSEKNWISDFWKRNGIKENSKSQNHKCLKNCYLILFHLSSTSSATTTLSGVKSQRKALIKGMKYTKTKSTYSYVLLNNGIVEIILKYVLRNDVTYQEHATKILRNLSCCENTSIILSKISFPIIVKLLVTGSEMTQENLGIFLGNLASHGDDDNDGDRLLIFRNHTVTALLEVLNHSKSENVQASILFALNNLATIPIIITHLYGSGCVSTIINVLSSNSNPSTELISNACSILGSISRYPSLRDDFSQEYVIQTIGNILLILSTQLTTLDSNSLLSRSSTSLLTSCCHISDIVSNLSWSYSIRIIFNKEENIHVLENLAQIIRLFRFLFLPNPIKSIISLEEYEQWEEVEEEDEHAQEEEEEREQLEGDKNTEVVGDSSFLLILRCMENASRALSNLAISDFNREPIRHTRILPLVIKLLYLPDTLQRRNMSTLVIEKSESVVEACTSLICNLSKSYTLMNTIMELNGMDALIHILIPKQIAQSSSSSSSPDKIIEEEFQQITGKDYYLMNASRENAIEALSHLAFIDDIRIAIWESGVVSLLLELILTNIHSTQISSQHNLPEFSYSYSSSVQYSIITLANISFCKILSHALISTNILDIMIDILMISQTPDKWKEYAALFVANLIHLEETKVKISQPAVTTALRSLLQSCEELNTLVAVNKALENVPSDPSMTQSLAGEFSSILPRISLPSTPNSNSNSSSSSPSIVNYAEWRGWILNTLRLYI